ncbi:hypothetical protein CDAR_9521 [Caerostris darwini]|uniref:Uncharacterized protein n=1 Tax=Caerostris darwini TaxID=1538125 RepID=A0AAV4TNB8_9ARAC|nr:hypothetical protein CDAR_9521 [Caerostris darwini]
MCKQTEIQDRTPQAFAKPYAPIKFNGVNMHWLANIRLTLASLYANANNYHYTEAKTNTFTMLSMAISSIPVPFISKELIMLGNSVNDPLILQIRLLSDRLGNITES